MGSNRVISSKLFLIASHLNVSPNYFFEPLSKHFSKPMEYIDDEKYGQTGKLQPFCDKTRLAEITSALPSGIRNDVLPPLEKIADIHLER